jgi:hypothetical protein
MLSDRTRVDPNAQVPYFAEGEDGRFVTNFAARMFTATSHGRHDGGMFELSFHDERYLPFEGAGADSRWRAEVHRECNGWDVDTMMDFIVTLNYTAREGGELLGQRAREAVIAPEQSGERLFSLKHDFPNEWYHLLHPTGSTSSVTLDMRVERFPFQFRDREIEITEVELFVKPRVGVADPQVALHLTAPADEPNEQADAVELTGALGSLLSGSKPYTSKGPGAWALRASPLGAASLADTMGDIAILCHYSVSAVS